MMYNESGELWGRRQAEVLSSNQCCHALVKVHCMGSCSIGAVVCGRVLVLSS